MADFFSHAGKDEVGKKYGSKLLKRHTFGVLENAARLYYAQHGFSLREGDDVLTTLKDICLNHDLGKYTHFFQDYLLGKPYDRILKQHARFGAQAILQQYGIENKIAVIAYFVIKNHHRSLHNPDAVREDSLLCSDRKEEVIRIFEQQRSSISSHLGQIENELGLSNLKDYLQLPETQNFRKFIRRWIEQQPDVEPYFFINYLFSLLIEGDKLDASDTALYKRGEIDTNSVSDFLSALAKGKNIQNDTRNQVRAEVIANLESKDILSKKLFMLTAPTGIGKTLTALDFALRLRARLSHKPQIVVGLPFINIIEQTLDVYHKVLKGSDAKILGHYQYADIFGESDADVDEEKNGQDYNRRRMELDTWQSDIVVTSFVQLLQTMISHKNKILLKFNHLAGAIVIMDEVQSLRLEQTPLIGAVLYYMSKFLGTRFLLMTATKPLIFELADKYLLQPKESCAAQVIHLLPDPERYFRQFHRTQIVPLIEKPLSDANEFIELFADKWSEDKSCLIVCNTVNRSIEVFEAIEGLSLNNPLYYLSTNVLPVLRMDIITRIGTDLKTGKKPILVATQVVEAGVDLDFDMGFRDMGPIDSIVQVAGRINRENSEERRYSPLYIVDFEDCKKVYGSITRIQAAKALGGEPIPECDYYQLVDKYFWNISERSAYEYSEKMFKGIRHLQYSSADVHGTEAIRKFKVIEESPQTLSVFVEWGKEAAPAKEAYLNMINAPDRETGFKLKEKFDKEFKRDFHQRIIAVPKYYTDGLPVIDENHPNMPIKWISTQMLKDWYIEPIGFNRKQAKVEQKEAYRANML
jgi:CRISPR-associated endonuclease/helicase Cas3